MHATTPDPRHHAPATDEAGLDRLRTAVRNRLDGGTTSATLAAELVAAGMPADAASRLLRAAVRRMELRRAMTGVAVGGLCLAAGVGGGLLAERPRLVAVGGLVGVIALASAALALLRCLTARGTPTPPCRVREATEASAGRDHAASWLIGTLRSSAARTRTWLIVCGVGLLLPVLTIPAGLLLLVMARKIRRDLARCLDLHARRDEAVVWIYVEQRMDLGLWSAWLVVGERTRKKRGRLLVLPVPSGDAARVLGEFSSRFPAAVLGYTEDRAKRFGRDPDALRADARAA